MLLTFSRAFLIDAKKQILMSEPILYSSRKNPDSYWWVSNEENLRMIEIMKKYGSVRSKVPDDYKIKAIKASKVGQVQEDSFNSFEEICINDLEHLITLSKK
jgi:hypothetical protein